MPRVKPLYYWDTNIWISWLMNESLPADVMAGIEDVIEAVERNQAAIIVSDCIDTELLTGEWTDEVRARFDSLFKRRNVQRVRITPNITKLSGEIRQYYRGQKQKTVAGLDALHLATAIVHGVDAFHTLDDGNKGGRSLLALNGNVAGHPLVICKPPPPAQPKLF